MTDPTRLVRSEMRPPATDAEWAVYHAIRRRVLFTLRGDDARYDPDHPDEHRAGHHPMILWDGASAVGVIRIDVRDAVAILRRVAVRDDVQRRGYGRRMLRLAVEFARQHQCRRVDSYVDPDAVGFYARCGFERVSGHASSDGGILMRLSLPAAASGE